MDDSSIGKSIIDSVYTNPVFDKTELRSVARQFGHATGTVLGVSIAAAMREKQPYIDDIYVAMIRSLMISSFDFALNHALEDEHK